MTPPKDVTETLWRISEYHKALTTIGQNYEDLHSLAWEKHVGDFERVNGGAQHPGVETVGNLKARSLLAGVTATLNDLDTLVRLAQAIGNFISAGSSPEETRGAHISRGDWHQSFKARDRRAARGEYTPVRIEQQPPYGGGR